MKVNLRKPIRLKNTTKYWSKDVSRTHVTFGSPSSYQSRRIKIEGYETRLYWQFRYCQEHNGQTFFYTLTYNDASIPQYEGFNCFDYNDLRDLLTGGFRKQLLRKYGTTFKYFIGAEFGDGKGSRGMHNNPHYHILFFLEDAKNEKFPYIQISPCNFRHLVRMYWQGFDEDVTGFQDYRTALFGIAKEGENFGLVTDFRACQYCAKYVCKDAGLKRTEESIEKVLRARIKAQLPTSVEFHNHFFRNELWNAFNVPLNSKHTEWLYPTAVSLIHYYLRGSFDTYANITDNLTGPVLEFCRQYKFWKQYYKAFHEFLELKVKEGLNEFRNRYCNKARISHGVGDYALQFVNDKLSPTIQVPVKDGFKDRPISMYYYRKLFTDVYIDKKGSPIRVLNDDGIRYKLNKLHDSIDKLKDKTFANVQIVLNDSELFERMRQSDVNTEVGMHYNDFVRSYIRFCSGDDLQLVLERYAKFKLVYEDRFFPYSPVSPDDAPDFPVLDCDVDYRRFLVPSFFTVNRSDIRLDLFLENGCPDCLPYSQHPDFLRYISLFRCFDLFSDYFFVQGDIKAQVEAEEIAAVKRFHDKRSLESFYSQFQ